MDTDPSDTKLKPPRRIRLITKRAALRIGVLLGIITLVALWACRRYVWMPGDSYVGDPPEGDDELLTLDAELERDLKILAEEIGERHVWKPAALAKAKEWIAIELRAAGWEVREETYAVMDRQVTNVIAERTGTTEPEKILVVGAHYDTIVGTPGANDNGTGVVGLLALARRWKDLEPARTLRLVAFVNEEPPFFQTDQMGSMVHAKGCKERGEDVVGAVVLETMGCFSDEPDSQHFPVGMLKHLYGDVGNFIAFVGSAASGPFTRDAIAVFRQHAKIPSEGAALPGAVAGVGWSDHWSFEQHGYQGFMITDTAPFRYAHYHEPTDTVDKIDFARLALVIDGVAKMVPELLGPQQGE